MTDLFNFKELDKLNVLNVYTGTQFDFNYHTKDSNQIKSELKRLFSVLQINPINTVIPKQSHTDNIAIITDENCADDFVDFDAVITNRKDIALATISADCQSIFVYDPVRKVIACIHSGWRGTLKQITKKTILKMIEVYNCNPADLIICISPSILQCCFEVDADVMELFRKKFGEKYIEKHDDKYHIDTVKINVDSLLDLGVLAQNIITSNICTKCGSKSFYSCRGDGEPTGRNLALVMLR